MTFKQLNEQAQRELGFSEADIKSATQYANLNSPNEFVNREVTLPPGVTERMLIDELKRFALMVRDNPEAVRAMLGNRPPPSNN